MIGSDGEYCVLEVVHERLGTNVWRFLATQPHDVRAQDALVVDDQQGFSRGFHFLRRRFQPEGYVPVRRFSRMQSQNVSYFVLVGVCG